MDGLSSSQEQVVDEVNLGEVGEYVVVDINGQLQTEVLGVDLRGQLGYVSVGVGRGQFAWIVDIHTSIEQVKTADYKLTSTKPLLS